MVGLAFPLVLVTGKESPVNISWENNLEPFPYRATLPCNERATGPLPTSAWALDTPLGAGAWSWELGLDSEDGWGLGLG